MTQHVIPARRLLTVVHVRDPKVPAEHRTEADPASNFHGTRLTADSHDGMTLCGERMRVDEQWTTYDPAVQADRICGACETGAAAYIQEAMI